VSSLSLVENSEKPRKFAMVPPNFTAPRPTPMGFPRTVVGNRWQVSSSLTCELDMARSYVSDTRYLAAGRGAFRPKEAQQGSTTGIGAL